MGWIKRLFARRMDEADVNRESIKAAEYYCKQTGQMHLADKQRIINWVAHGFSVGLRWHEEQMGIQRKDAFGRKR